MPTWEVPGPKADARQTASSNADGLTRTPADELDSECLITPNGRTDSDGTNDGRARLLIRRFPIISMRGQVDHPGWGWPEVAGIEVERRQVLFEVDVKPLTACRLGVPDGVTDKGLLPFP